MRLCIRETQILWIAPKAVSKEGVKAWPNWTTLFANMSIIMLEECSWTSHVVDRSGQIGQHCSPTNSIRHKLNAVYVVLAAV